MNHTVYTYYIHVYYIYHVDCIIIDTVKKSTLRYRKVNRIPRILTMFLQCELDPHEMTSPVKFFLPRLEI
jgi:hypothetical protein